MKRLSPANIDAEVLAMLHANPAEKQAQMWKYTNGDPRKFKDQITSHLTTNQSRRCAYCGLRLLGAKHHRDHIAPKESHPEFTFVSANLVLACYHCNTDRKDTQDTVSAKNAEYSNCLFTIVHPYFDEPTQHFEFVGATEKILIQVVNGSAKGTETIRMFDLASPEMSKQRAKDALIDTDLEHLPGNWQEGFLQATIVRLQTKFRTE
jgi:uncharacterized protein (TIGR02646 family)